MVYDTNIHHIHLTDTLCHPILVKTLTATNVSRLRKLKVPSATLAEATCSLRVCRIHIRNNPAAVLHLNARTIRYTLACKQLCWHTGSSQSCTGSSQEDLGRPIQDWEYLCRPVKTTLHPPSEAIQSRLAVRNASPQSRGTPDSNQFTVFLMNITHVHLHVCHSYSAGRFAHGLTTQCRQGNAGGTHGRLAQGAPTVDDCMAMPACCPVLQFRLGSGIHQIMPLPNCDRLATLAPCKQCRCCSSLVHSSRVR